MQCASSTASKTSSFLHDLLDPSYTLIGIGISPTPDGPLATIALAQGFPELLAVRVRKHHPMQEIQRQLTTSGMALEPPTVPITLPPSHASIIPDGPTESPVTVQKGVTELRFKVPDGVLLAATLLEPGEHTASGPPTPTPTPTPTDDGHGHGYGHTKPHAGPPLLKFQDSVFIDYEKHPPDYPTGRGGLGPVSRVRVLVRPPGTGRHLLGLFVKRPDTYVWVHVTTVELDVPPYVHVSPAPFPSTYSGFVEGQCQLLCPRHCVLTIGTVHTFKVVVGRQPADHAAERLACLQMQHDREQEEADKKRRRWQAMQQQEQHEEDLRREKFDKDAAERKAELERELKKSKTGPKKMQGLASAELLQEMQEQEMLRRSAWEAAQEQMHKEFVEKNDPEVQQSALTNMKKLVQKSNQAAVVLVSGATSFPMRPADDGLTFVSSPVQIVPGDIALFVDDVLALSWGTCAS